MSRVPFDCDADNCHGPTCAARPLSKPRKSCATWCVDIRPSALRNVVLGTVPQQFKIKRCRDLAFPSGLGRLDEVVHLPGRHIVKVEVAGSAGVLSQILMKAYHWFAQQSFVA